MDDFDDFLGSEIDGLPDADLLEDVKRLIREAAFNAPRSLQKALGPSEVGHPCARKLALGMRGVRGHNRGGDPLASIIGIATHAWLENACRLDNDRLGRYRWIPESKVMVVPKEGNHPGLKGSCDLYDRDTNSVLDFKVPGATRFKKYTTKGPSPTYRAQVHLYGRGYLNLGLPVEHVGIIFIPRAGTLRGAKIWREPYNQALVDEVLARIDNTLRLIELLDLEHNLNNYRMIPITPDEDCYLCPFFVPPDTEPNGPLQCNQQSVGRNVTP